jgi:hypothetical protein
MKPQSVHEKIVVFLKQGIDSPDGIRVQFKDRPEEQLMYRLSVYINTIKHRGGVIRVSKSGKWVIKYELKNPEMFDENGRFIKGNM